MGHLCGGLYTRDPSSLSAHVSHYGGSVLGGRLITPGSCLCLRTRDVAGTPARRALLDALAPLFTGAPAEAPDVAGATAPCEAPNTVETLVRSPAARACVCA
jgi:hypothetical protein